MMRGQPYTLLRIIISTETEIFIRNNQWGNDKTNKSREAALKSIKEAEYMARLWPRLRKYSKGEVRSGLNKIEIPVYDTTGEIVDYRMVSESTERLKEIWSYCWSIVGLHPKYIEETCHRH